MRALITGGAGFIGSHLAEVLALQGHEVTVLDDLSTGSLDNLAHVRRSPGFECVIDNVTDDRVVRQLVDRADLVYHLAAAVGVKLVLDAPIHTIHTNIAGTENVLRHASRARKRVLVASTSEVYGKGHALPFREDADLVMGPPDKTRWGYATSKLMDEFLALAYAKEHGVPVVIVRLFNTVGPRQTGRYGMVIPNFVRRALVNEPLVVHGDGSQTRSFTWVGDVVWALAALMHEPRAAGQVFNVGNGREVSIRDLAFKVREMTGSRSPVIFQPYDAVFDSGFEDMPRRVPDIDKLRRYIGFEPKVHLEGILKAVIDYWAPALGIETLRKAVPRRYAAAVGRALVPAAAG